MHDMAVQYILDEQGNTTGVIVPIELWKNLQSELATAYLLESETMKQRLMAAQARNEGIPLEAVRAKLGI